MIKLKSLILESLSQEEYEIWLKSSEYKTWRDNWLDRHNAKFDDKGRVIAYHATTHKKAKLIKQNGFNKGSNFSLRPEYSRSIVKWYHDLKDRGIALLEVRLPLDAITFVASDIVSLRPIKWEEVV